MMELRRKIVPLLLDDQEEDAGGDAEDDGEHRDDSRKDDVVKEHRGGRASVDFHLVQDWVFPRGKGVIFWQGNYQKNFLGIWKDEYFGNVSLLLGFWWSKTEDFFADTF